MSYYWPQKDAEEILKDIQNIPWPFLVKEGEHLGIVEKDILTKNISKEERIKHIKWASSAIEKRVDAIVSNKYRGSYDKAALLLIGCVDALTLLDRSTEAQTLFNKIKARYNRYSAFQQEIKRFLKMK